mgnify:CR=1 FL=1
MKKGQVAIFIVVALILVGALVLVAWIRDKDVPETDVIECNTADDCVPDECCDASSCVPKSERPDCTVLQVDGSREDIICAPGCGSDRYVTLGCNWRNPGTCTCVNNKCVSSYS